MAELIFEILIVISWRQLLGLCRKPFSDSRWQLVGLWLWPRALGSSTSGDCPPLCSLIPVWQMLVSFWPTCWGTNKISIGLTGKVLLTDFLSDRWIATFLLTTVYQQTCISAGLHGLPSSDPLHELLYYKIWSPHPMKQRINGVWARTEGSHKTIWEL